MIINIRRALGKISLENGIAVGIQKTEKKERKREEILEGARFEGLECITEDATQFSFLIHGVQMRIEEKS